MPGRDAAPQSAGSSASTVLDTPAAAPGSAALRDRVLREPGVDRLELRAGGG
jgi:hypothetical protein